jgi:muramoyltetrapeptide carboxypeptidase
MVRLWQHPAVPTEIVWPPPVHPGARVGVAALSGAVAPEALAAGLDTLRAFGLEPVTARNVGLAWGPFAGTDEERVAGLHELLADDSLAAILFARGGHGLLRVIDRLDWQAIAARPRAWIGYSDLTPLLLAIVERCGWVTFHGPMVATDLARGLDAAEAASFAAALAGAPPASLPIRFLREGEASGIVLGGCLSLLAEVAGTAWEPSLRGALLFVEDVNEPAYRIDRMLTHLRLSGTLSSVRAIVAGHFGGEWESGIADAGPAAAWQRESLLALPHPAAPVAYGLSCGHGRPNLTLPLGVRGRLDPLAGTLSFDLD